MKKTGTLVRPKALAAAAALCLLSCGNALANVDQHELDMLNAAKNIEYASQKIAKAYFYKQMDIRADRAEADLKESLTNLKQDIIKLQGGTEGKEEKNIATFLSSTHEDMGSILSKPYSKEEGALMIDYSESLLEGASVLSSKHRGKSTEASMLTEVEQLLFLLERVNKYYIAHKAGFKDYNNIVQLEEAVSDFEAGMAKINAYTSYPENIQASLKNINQFWPTAKDFYLGVQQGTLPVIVLASTEKLEKEIKKLELFHHQAVVK